MTRASWRSRLRGALARTRGDLSSAERTTTAFGASTPPGLDKLNIGLLIFAILILIGNAYAAEGGNPLDQSTAANLKSLGTEYGLLGTLLAIAIGAICFLFGLLLKAGSSREAALQVQQAAHEKAMAEKETAHARDRNDWFAAQQIQQEARVGLLREVMTALSASTTALGSFQKTVDERTKTAEQLQANVGELTNAVQAMRSSVNDASEASRRAITGIQDDLNALSREVRKT